MSWLILFCAAIFWIGGGLFVWRGVCWLDVEFKTGAIGVAFGLSGMAIGLWMLRQLFLYLNPAHN